VAAPVGRAWQVEQRVSPLPALGGDGRVDALLKTPSELAGCDRTADMIDSTVVCAHQCAAGIEKELARPRRRPVARRLVHQARCMLRRAGTTARLRADARADARHPGFGPSFQMIGDHARMLLADGSYDTDAIGARGSVRARGGISLIAMV
jgi:hypothetical protein